MTTSILNDCLLLRNEPIEKLREYFKTINVDIFDAIFSKYAESPNEAIWSILFIVCAYSEESPMVILRQDNRAEMEGICEYLQMPEYFRNRLYTLHDQEIRLATTRYLSQFSGPLFKTYKFLLIQMNDLELDITNRNFGEKKEQDGENEDDEKKILFHWDLKEHGKAVTEYARISKQISSLELTIKHQVKRLEGIEGLVEFKMKTGRTRSSGRGVSIEHSNRIG